MTIFNYEGNKVTFRNNEGVVFVNATEMAKPFGKRPKDYLKLDITKLFIKTLREDYPFDLISVQKGGSTPGTWIHEDVALDFAQWLSPVFRVWCNKKLKELISTGETAIHQPSEDEVILKALTTLQNRIEVQANQLLLANQTIQEQAPQVQYVQEVLNSDSLLSVNVIAKELGMSAISLNYRLQELKIQYKQSGMWLLYHQYQNKGYTKTKTYTYYDSTGKQQTSMQTYWTEQGRAFIHSKINQVFNTNKGKLATIPAR